MDGIEVAVDNSANAWRRARQCAKDRIGGFSLGNKNERHNII